MTPKSQCLIWDSEVDCVGVKDLVKGFSRQSPRICTPAARRKIRIGDYLSAGDPPKRRQHSRLHIRPESWLTKSS